MDFLETPEIQILGVAVALVAVAAAVYFFSSKKPKGCLDPDNFKDFKLVKRTLLSHNVAKFRFELPTPTSMLGLPIGQHISCRGKDVQGEDVIKPYTPTTLDSDRGYFELVIKMYPQGRMSHHFREMRVGDYMAVKGPKGRFKYQPGQVRAFGMLAGGSGITPMFQVARAILENPQDRTKLHLIYANVTYEDILLKVANGCLCDVASIVNSGPGEVLKPGVLALPLQLVYLLQENMRFKMQQENGKFNWSTLESVLVPGRGDMCGFSCRIIHVDSRFLKL
ncbi:unnamed protein product [Ilex paraguariensis]|uniref:cytochrome-b5 reductase n=1 Tax=Ilex paraguariensis TaxID=185542 RepID=A0ABC8U4I5_9AQUA